MVIRGFGGRTSNALSVITRAAFREWRGGTPTVFRWSPATAVIWSVMLIVVASGFSYFTLDVLSWAWDDGNNTYAWGAIKVGDLPNIDFRHGYPGLMGWMQFYLFGNSDAVFFWAKLSGCVFSLIVAVCGFLVCFRSVSFLPAVGVFFFVFGVTFSAVPSANPGYGMEACIAVGVTLIYFALQETSGVDSRVHLRETLFILGGLIVGTSVGFKQPGVFAMVGFLGLVIALAPRHGVFRVLRPLAFALGCVLPLVVFLIARVGPLIPMAPYRLATVLPWIVATLWIWRFAFREPGGLTCDTALSGRAAFLAPLACGLGAMSWMIMYPLDAATLTVVLEEIYITVPRLIDRDPGNRKLDLELLALVISVGLLLVGLTHRPGNSSPAILRRLAAVRSSLPIQWFLLVVLVVAAVAVGKFERELFVTPALLGAAGGLLLYFERDWRPSAQVFAVLLIGLCATASLFPYPGNVRYVAIGLAACLAVFCWAIGNRGECRSLSLRQPLLSGLALLYCGGVASFGFSLMVQSAQQSKIALDPRFGVRAAQFVAPMADAAAWVRSQVAEEDTVAGYPNFAIVCVLLRRPCWGFLPNFIGTEDDFDAMVSSIANGTGPTYFLVSPTVYPYQPNHPYFPDPGPLIEALEAKYQLMEVIQIPDRNAEVRIYRSSGSEWRPKHAGEEN